MRQVAEAGDPQRHPAQYVQASQSRSWQDLASSMEAARPGAAPVAADVGVGLVPESDRLQVLDGHDVTELPGTRRSP